MKLFISHFDKDVFEKKMEHLAHIDFSLFVDLPTTHVDLSPINILVLQEPNEYFGMADWAIQNSSMFNVIYTWNDKVLNNCSNARLLPFGHTWFKPEQYQTPKPKKFELTHLCGNLLKTYGHSLRHELMARQNEIKSIPLNFHQTYGDRYDIEDARKGKEFLFGNSMFGVAIENTSHNGYFTEKLLDCFLMRTVPIYWGCSDLRFYFNEEGIFNCSNVDEIIYFANNVLSESYYQCLEKVIEKNYQSALKYVDYEQRIVDEITNLFRLNGILAV